MTTNIHKHRILILDFGSQYTQLIARRIREIGVYCELWAWDVSEEQIREFNPNGIILSGGLKVQRLKIAPRARVRFSCWCACIGYLLWHANYVYATGRRGRSLR